MEKLTNQENLRILAEAGAKLFGWSWYSEKPIMRLDFAGYELFFSYNGMPTMVRNFATGKRIPDSELDEFASQLLFECCLDNIYDHTYDLSNIPSGWGLNFLDSVS